MTSLSLFTFIHWRRKWQSTPVFLPGESQRRESLVGYHLWSRTESDTTQATYQQQQHSHTGEAQNYMPLTISSWGRKESDTTEQLHFTSDYQKGGNRRETQSIPFCVLRYLDRPEPAERVSVRPLFHITSR